MSEKNSPVRAPLLPYTAVADLIVQLMGKGCEVVLHDLDTPQHSVVYVAGESVTGRKPGQGFRHLVSELIRTPRETPNITPNWFFEHEGKPVRSTTLFIRNSRGELTGALCVNLDVTGAVRDFERLASLLPGLAGINPLSE
ncbi:MAG: PAS domain-containing protein, partial [Duodenibacillus sp.]|nr:PAS domain-containing protein [Duodenibacillus sp.]